jgi:hypothetical protein
MMQNGTEDLVTPQRLETTTCKEQSPPPNGEEPLTKMLSYIPLRASRSHHTFPVRFPLPQRGFSSALITGTIAGMLSALLTILIILINTGTFYAARLQIAVDKLTVKTALALAALELLTFVLSLLIGFAAGFVVGRIAVRHRFGFLAGACAGALSFLIIFLVSLLPSYPGNLIMTGALTSASLVISFLLLCLWSLGGGLVSLFGTWVATVRHPYYLRRRG